MESRKVLKLSSIDVWRSLFICAITLSTCACRVAAALPDASNFFRILCGNENPRTNLSWYGFSLSGESAIATANELNVRLAQLPESIKMILSGDVLEIRESDFTILQTEHLRVVCVATLFIPGLQVEAGSVSV
jgi:hypothetical protein